MTRELLPIGTHYQRLLDEFHREVDDLMNRLFGASEEEDRASGFVPDVNVVETGDAYIVHVDLPGTGPEHINVEIKQGDLWITGERPDERARQDRTWHCVESRYGKFRRVIRLDGDVDRDHVEAHYKDGVLRVTVPKAESVRTKRVPVKT
ncbi:MAG TPA: Hsp20/alpha crystallin family protein [Planctomycetaceae bacterium]|nr:Hsp20/alpha crystallin family protein [Planctomycetaceae bacterium]